MVKMACHCREDAATVQLLTAIISAVISPSRLAGMCHRRLVPVVLRIARQPYDHEDRQTLHIIFQNHRCRGRVVSRYGRLTAIMLLAAQSGHVQEMSSPLAGVPPCGPEGRLTVVLYGGIRAKLDWAAADLECLGMPRPNNEGARLRFAGTTDIAGETRRIAIIISLPELERGQTVQETPANITIMEEGGGRFFSSSEASFCLSDIIEQEQDAEGKPGEYRIRGVLYCVAALAELNGTGGVSLGDLRFSGQLDWQPPE